MIKTLFWQCDRATIFFLAESLAGSSCIIRNLIIMKRSIESKTPITELQEICDARKYTHPIYEFTGEELDASLPNVKIFTTSVTALGLNCTGKGRSKKDSKHDAANRLLKLLYNQDSSDVDMECDSSFSVLSTDKVTEVRDICVQRNYKMPEFECVRNSGPSHAPEFEYECRIGKIVRRGVHKTKKGAKQAACHEMVKVLQDMPVEDFEMQVQCLGQAAKDMKDNDDQTIRTYRELINSDVRKKPDVCIPERHRFFVELDNSKIDAARSIAMDSFMNVEDKCSSIPKSLGLKFDMKLENSDLLMKSGVKLYTFELLSTEFDCFIFGPRDTFFNDLYKYFRNMLDFD